VGLLGVGAALAALVGAGCGGERQDADEPEGDFPVEVSAASFPASQRVSSPVAMKIAVRNTGRRALPEVAVTLFKTGGGTQAAAFAQTSEQPGLASSSRPVWIIQDGPRDGDSAYANTWTLGPLAAGKTKTFVWDVVPIQGGRYSISYRVAAGLTGRAKAVAPGGGPVEGRFRVRIDDTPAQSEIADDGAVETAGRPAT
jgi:hypothetical protein